MVWENFGERFVDVLFRMDLGVALVLVDIGLARAYLRRSLLFKSPCDRRFERKLARRSFVAAILLKLLLLVHVSRVLCTLPSPNSLLEFVFFRFNRINLALQEFVFSTIWNFFIRSGQLLKPCACDGRTSKSAYASTFFGRVIKPSPYSRSPANQGTFLVIVKPR